jgi:hypothetical protein
MKLFQFNAKRFIGVAFAFTVALSVTGCIAFRSTEGPMTVVEDKLACATRPSTLIVMLPGARDVPQDFFDQGFVKAVRDRHIQADMLLVDSHIAYYTKMQIIDRLEKEVVLPARARGYKTIWFAGISLGGYGTLLYSSKTARDYHLSVTPNGPLTGGPKKTIDGFFTMAPYMGSSKITRAITAQGGLRSANLAKAPDGSTAPDNFDLVLWQWLQSYASLSSQSSSTVSPSLTPTNPSAWLGWGSKDGFAEMNALLGDVLPNQQRIEEPGGHDWPPWIAMWHKFLDRAPIARSADAANLCQLK